MLSYIFRETGEAFKTAKVRPTVLPRDQKKEGKVCRNLAHANCSMCVTKVEKAEAEGQGSECGAYGG